MKIKEYKEMMAYLTRPKDSLKEIFKNKKNKKPIDARTASLNKVSDTKVPPKNTLEQQIINKTKELSEDKITTKRPIVKDHFTKQLINANNTFDESGTPRASGVTFYTSFDETGSITFDETGTETFDEGVGGKSFDSNLISMDSNAHTLDETL